MTPERWKRVTELFLETSNVSHRPVSASREPSGPPSSVVSESREQGRAAIDARVLEARDGALRGCRRT